MHFIDRQTFDGRFSLDNHRRTRMFQCVELQNTEGRQRPHVVRPQQLHQRVAELRQLVIEFLPQAASQECKALQQTLNIGVSTGLP
ncbi:hypothetical protein D3C72_2124320 [compost metagenome]